MKPHNNQAIFRGGGGDGYLHLYRIALAPWMKVDYQKLENLEMRARNMRVNVSTWQRSRNAPQVGSEYSVTIVGDAGSVELKADGDLLAIIAGALDDWEAYAWTPEELVTIAAQSGIEVRRG